MTMRKKLPENFDPKKPLSNPKHEIIARERAKGSNKVDAYLKAYPKASYDSARAETHIIDRNGIDLRALHLLAEKGMTEGDLFQSLVECVRSEDGRLKFDSTKFSLGLIGYGKEQKCIETSYNPVQIIIKQIDILPQSIDTKEDTINK